MPKGRAISIDIETELKAIKNGECGSCRIGATHISTVECNATHQKRFPMKHCEVCEIMYCSDWFKECPECKPDKNIKI